MIFMILLEQSIKKGVLFCSVTKKQTTYLRDSVRGFENLQGHYKRDSV